MSEPTDIKALDEYLKRDSEVSERYRELGSDDVPPELDRRVLAAARDAVANEGASRSRSWLRWSAPVALAASFVLVVTVVLEGGLQQPQIAQEQDRAEAAPRPSAEPAGAASADKANATDERKLVDELRKQQDAVSSYNVAPVQNAPPPAREFAPSPPAALAPPAPSASSVAKTEAERMKPAAPAQEVVVTGDRLRSSGQEAAAPVTTIKQDDLAAAASAPEADSSTQLEEVVMTGARRRATGRTAGPRNTVSTQSFRNDRPASDEQADRSDPKAWLEEIRQLRRDGKTADADREWLRFLEAYPNFPVANDDLARKKP